MPECSNYPFPEDPYIEISVNLACLVNSWVFIYKFIIDVLFKPVSKKTSPTTPYSVVHCREHVSKKDLSTESVLHCKVYFSEG
jgi:hypothetical protein